MQIPTSADLSHVCILVAICSDDGRERSRIQKLLKAYRTEHSRNSFTIEWYDNAEKLLSRVKERNYPPDLLLLDINLPEKLRPETVRALWEIGSRCRVLFFASPIFLTSAAEFALEAFWADAMQYVMKPVLEENLFPVLEQCLEQLVYSFENAV